MTDSTTAVYAVVKKSKKQRRNSIVENEVALPSFDSPVYDMAETPAVPPPSHGRGEVDSEYSMVTLDNMYSQVSKTKQGKEPEATIQGPSQTSATNADKQWSGGSGCKILVCILITIGIVAVITLICLAVLFAEVSKLRAQNTSTAQSTTSQLMEDDLSSIRLQLQQIQEDFSTMKDFMNGEYSRFHNAFNMLSEMFNKAEQVNLDKFQQLNSSINTTQTQLDMSVDQLNQQLDTVIPQLNSTLNSQQASLLALNSSFEMGLMQYSGPFHELQQLHPGQTRALPVSSCVALNDLPWSSPSGYYWVRASNSSAVRVYCDMTRSCGGVTGGWMRVAELDMRNSSHRCPSGLQFSMISFSKRICRINSVPAACSPTIAYSTVLEYSKVCGRIRAFPVGHLDGFQSYALARVSTIDDNYVDGVSLTHGDPCQHIWTFSAHSSGGCSCNAGSAMPPSFVGTEYFCDIDGGTELWQECTASRNSCCSLSNPPPWFYKHLMTPTTDSIEMRVCRDESRANEDIQIQAIDLYVR
jgi:hypothetical protein